ncbi:MAG: SEC-C domain-containing protein, partial [Nitrosomonas sp.]|nr:SEC-C domain-containing protein [Nitrosomonas sp.]
QWDVPGLEKALATEFLLHLTIKDWLEKEPELHEENLQERIIQIAHQHYQDKVSQVGVEIMHQYERAVMLQSLDSHWREHLAALDHLRQGIHLRGYAQKNPKQEYKREAFELFANMLEAIKAEVTKILMMVQIKSEEQVEAVAETQRIPANMQYQHAEYGSALDEKTNKEDDHAEKTQPFVRQGEKVGRNAPCPCGSGKKYKQCHGKIR